MLALALTLEAQAYVIKNGLTRVGFDRKSLGKTPVIHKRIDLIWGQCDIGRLYLPFAIV